MDFSIKPCPQGLSDHDAQLLIMNDIQILKHPAHYLTRRVINDSSILDFQLKLSYESWYNVFNNDDIDTIFNNFLNTYLRIFNYAFPPKKCHDTYNHKPWLTPGIIIANQHERDLFYS
jgi:hypothetical protein